MGSTCVHRRWVHFTMRIKISIYSTQPRAQDHACSRRCIQNTKEYTKGCTHPDRRRLQGRKYPTHMDGCAEQLRGKQCTAAVIQASLEHNKSRPAISRLYAQYLQPELLSTRERIHMSGAVCMLRVCINTDGPYSILLAMY